MVENFKLGKSSPENLREKELVEEQTKLEIKDLKMEVADNDKKFKTLCEKSSLTVSEAKRIVEIYPNYRKGVEGEYLELKWLTSITPEVARELSKFKGRSLELKGLTSITPEVARELSKFKGNLELNGLTSIMPEVARELSKFKGKYLTLNGLTSITPEVARELSKFKGEMLFLNGLRSMTPWVSRELSKLGDSVFFGGMAINRAIRWRDYAGYDDKIQKSWEIERGKFKFDWKNRMIKSWGQGVDVDVVLEKNMKLSGLGLALGIKEGVWLANFKNRLKSKYGDKKVEFKRNLINKTLSLKKTFVVGNTMLISREDIEKYIPICSDDRIMEKILEWLNK